MEKKHYGQIIANKAGFDLIKCKLCGFIHLSPIPSQKYLTEFYRKKYYQSQKSQQIKADIEEEDYLNIDFKERLEIMKKKSPGNKILDIGCGTGRFLKLAKKQGWSVQGIEVSRMAAEVAKNEGIPVDVCDLSEYCMKKKHKFYDAIHIDNVLEHVADPQNTLKQCRSLLNECGVLCLEVPNDFNIIQRLGIKRVKEEPSWIAIPDHINYFNFKTIKLLVKKHGFKVYSYGTNFPIYFFLILGKNFIKDKKLGSELHKKRMRFELFLYRYKLDWLKRAFYNIIAKMDLGRGCILYCIKK